MLEYFFIVSRKHEMKDIDWSLKEYFVGFQERFLFSSTEFLQKNSLYRLAGDGMCTYTDSTI